MADVDQTDAANVIKKFIKLSLYGRTRHKTPALLSTIAALLESLNSSIKEVVSTELAKEFDPATPREDAFGFQVATYNNNNKKKKSANSNKKSAAGANDASAFQTPRNGKEQKKAVLLLMILFFFFSKTHLLLFILILGC